MKGIILSEPNKIEVAEILLAKRKNNQATVKILSVGICGSDVTAFLGKNPTVTYPRVVGHEAMGEIIEIEENVYDLKVGDRVVIRPFINCESCEPCNAGNGNNCENLQVIGVREDGAMAEKINHPLNHLIKLPNSLPNHIATMVEPLSISLHSIRRGKVKGGYKVVIFGAGTIGLLAAMICKAYGAIPILIDINESRLKTAKKKGIEYTINSGNLDEILPQVKDYLEGKLPDVVIECSGSEIAMSNSIEVVKYSGTVVFVGWASGHISIEQPRILKKEITLTGSRNSFNEFPECIRLLNEKEVDVEDLINVRSGFDEIVKGINDLIEKPSLYTKIISELNI